MAKGASAAVANALHGAAQDLKCRVLELLGYRPAAMRNAERVFADKRLIFCVTNGRTGSQALARMFSCLREVDANHEPKPSFHLIMRRVQKQNNLAKQFWLYTKLPAIAKHQSSIYIETSHLFSKGFVEPLLELGGRPSLIFLNRDPRDIAKSMYALNDIPGRTQRAIKWYLKPEDARFLRVPLDTTGKLSDYQLCYWHALESQSRQEYYCKLSREMGLLSVSTNIKMLNDWDNFQLLCEQLKLPINHGDRERVLPLLGQKLNTRNKEKLPTEMTDSQIEYEETALISMLEDLGALENSSCHNTTSRESGSRLPNH